MTLLESKREKPLSLVFDNGNYLYIGQDETLPLENGVVFGDDHFGFDLTVVKDGIKHTVEYQTQCPIYGVQVYEGALNVLEHRKMIPWKFTLDGELLQAAVFSQLQRTEADYILERFGVSTPEQLQQLNTYQKVKK